MPAHEVKAVKPTCGEKSKTATQKSSKARPPAFMVAAKEERSLSVKSLAVRLEKIPEVITATGELFAEEMATISAKKGYGLALAGWILTSLLSGAWRTGVDRDRVLGETPDPKYGFAQEGIGHCFAAVRLDQFGDPKAFRQGMDAMIQAINDSRPAAGVPRVLVPGQDAHATAQERLREGIPINAATMAALQSLAEQYNVPL